MHDIADIVKLCIEMLYADSQQPKTRTKGKADKDKNNAKHGKREGVAKKRRA